MKLLQAFVFLLFFVTAAQAQTPAAPAAAPAASSTTASATTPATAGAAAQAGAPQKAAGTAPAAPGGIPDEMRQPFAGSFFFTPLEITAIQDALRGKVTANTSAMLNRSTAGVPAVREIRVAGVLYRSPSNWIVWMNNHKVTPDDKLPEIIDIDVKRSSNVNLKWYDSASNKILMITLRPHQTYDIATGILLPQ